LGKKGRFVIKKHIKKDEAAIRKAAQNIVGIYSLDPESGGRENSFSFFTTRMV